MSSALQMSELFSLRRRFYRSVELEKDIQNPLALEGYILTPLARETLNRIIEGLEPAATNRAWTLTGPYGSGKSAFALFLAQLLGPTEHRATKTAMQIAKSSKEELEERVRQARSRRAKGFLRITVGGSRSDLFPTLVAALGRGVEEFFEKGELPRSRMKVLKDLQRGETGGVAPNRVLCDLVAGISSDVVEAGGRGVLFIIDELGKFLEHMSSVGPGQADIFILQQLAELAARSGDTPVLLITMLHQAFATYAVRLPPSVVNEWAKVQGRFEDLSFIDSSDQMLHLAAETILRKQDGAKAYAAYDRATDFAVKQGMAPSKLKETLRQMAPLHPTTSLILPELFRQTLAQHERSLFGFLTSEYQNGFAAFLRETALEKADKPTFYRLDQLYDFLMGTLGPALYTGSNGKRWAEMDQSLNRLKEEHPPLAARVIKVIGLLSQFGAKGLRAQKEVIGYALMDGQTSYEEVEQTIDALEQQSIIRYRRYNEAYGLWEGSDVDLESHLQAAKGQVDRSNITSLLGSRLTIEPKIARRHFIETGTLRYFSVELIRPEELAGRCEAPLKDEDGRILCLLPKENDSDQEVLQQAKALTRAHDAVIVCIPRNTAQILDAAITWCAWSHVRETVTALEGDPVARKELAACLTKAESELDRALQAGFGFGTRDEMTATWVHDGKVQDWSTPRAVTAALSSICNKLYKLAPLLHNELLNRRVLSSAAAAARRDLLIAMSARGEEERLGIEGAPPEYSMYASLLEQGGLHQLRGDKWGFGAPPSEDKLKLRPAWDCIQAFLRTTEVQRRPVPELYAELAKAPYGIKEGVSPVLLMVAILAADGESALFEEGTYLPELSQSIVERFQRRPQRFEVARYTIDGARTRVVEQLAELLITDPEKKPRPMTLVRELYQRAGRWPQYARTTQRLGSVALAVRNALLNAKDPLRLLFVDLPQAVGVKLALGTGVDPLFVDLVGPLRSALTEINNAYPNLLQDIEHQLIRVLDLRDEGPAMREELTKRAKAIRKFATDLKLQSFVLRAADETLSHEMWLESLATLIASKPPSQWLDADLGRFEAALFELGRAFLRTEELAFDAQGAVDGGEVIDLLRVSITSYGVPERRRLVRLHPMDEKQANDAEQRLDEMLEQMLRGRPEMKLAVLGRLSRHVIDGMEERRPQPRAQAARREKQR